MFKTFFCFIFTILLGSTVFAVSRKLPERKVPLIKSYRREIIKRNIQNYNLAPFVDYVQQNNNNNLQQNDNEPEQVDDQDAPNEDLELNDDE